jgi:hypothetical protein
MYGTVLVDAQGAAHQLQTLAMKCDAKGIPQPMSGAEPSGWWLVEDCTFGGSVRSGGDAGTSGAPREASIKGQAAMAVCADRIIGILSPGPATGPAMWWSWSLGDLDVGSSGSQGVFKKRPQALRLDRNGGVGGAAGDTIVLKGVAKLLRNSGRFQTGQEASLLEALRR